MAIDNYWAGAVLRHARQLAGVTREQIAKACGVTPGAVSHWESGRSVPNAAQMAAFSEVTGVPIETMYGEMGLTPVAKVTSLREWYLARKAQGKLNPWRRGAHKSGVAGDNAPDQSEGGRLELRKAYQSPALAACRAS